MNPNPSIRSDLRPTAYRYDRADLLARTGLGELADELLGGHVGTGRTAKWPSPVPGHPQTGATPPMSIFRTRTGEQRWTCFATGTSGTAIDLVMVSRACDVRTAIEWLAQRASQRVADAHRWAPPALPGPVTTGSIHRGPDRLAPRPVSPRVEAYVTTCERKLWTAESTETLEWLTDVRGLDEAVLRVNRVGYDPGPSGFARPNGLPRLGAAVVFPVLDDRHRAIFCQARYLDPTTAGRKYDNPRSWLALNPKMTKMRPATYQPDKDLVIVTEGIPDGLAAATIGFNAIAILGVANAGPDVARRLAALDTTLVIAFDNDDAGRAGTTRLIDALSACGRTDNVRRLRLPQRFDDLNQWMLAKPDDLSAAFEGLARQRTVGRGAGISR